MRNLAAYFFGIVLMFVVFAFALDAIYTASFKTGFSRNKPQYITQLSDTHIDFVFLGSSRVENHIDCELITLITGKSCINLGLQGSKTLDSAAMLHILKDNNVTYEKVLFQLDYAVNFNAYTPTFYAHVLPFINSDELSENLQSKLEIRRENYLPFYRYASNDKLIGFREVLLQYMRKPPRIDFLNGFDGREGVGQDIKGSLPKEVVRSNKGIEWMQNIEGQKLVFFTAPYCQNAENRDDFAKNLQGSYPLNHSYIDLFDQQEEYFVDCGHLNKIGARHFTEIITKELLVQ